MAEKKGTATEEDLQIEEKEYSPEEMEEIQRILGVIDEAMEMPPPAPEPEPEEPEDAMEAFDEIAGDDALEPFDEGAGDDALEPFDEIAGDDALEPFDEGAGEDALEPFDESAGEDALEPFDESAGDDALEAFDESAGEDTLEAFDESAGEDALEAFDEGAGGDDFADDAAPDLSDVRQESLDDIETDAIDVTDIIQEVPDDAPAADDDIPELDGLDDLSGDIAEDDFSSDAMGEPLSEDEPVASDPLSQLDDLTRDEPESVDIQDRADDDEFVGDTSAASVDVPDLGLDEADPVDMADPEDIDIPLDDIDDAMPDSSAIDEESGDIPDLDDLSVDDAGDIPEAADDDMPDFDLDDLGMQEDEPSAAEDEPAEEESMLNELAGTDLESSLDGLDDLMAETEEPVPDETAAESSLDLPDEPMAADTLDAMPDAEEELTIEPLDDHFEEEPETAPPPQASGSESLELTDDELKRLKKGMMLFNPAIRQSIKETVVQDLLPPKETRQLVDMIISGKPEHNVHRFLERKLKSRIHLSDETSGSRRVIASRPAYTAEGRDRQQRLFRMTRIFGIAALAAFTVTILSYQFIYKPMMAKRKIEKGAMLIVRDGDYTMKRSDYAEAERLFNEVEENYRNNYLYGHTRYSTAYFDQKRYSESIDKLNRAYEWAHDRVRLLNKLGYYYSRVPAEKYRTQRGNLTRWYTRENPESLEGKAQLDVAIYFYRKALLFDAQNIEALVGIGDAYFHQGQYLKAKKYYLDILKVDPDSIAGYSGLLNLYIERDAFDLFATVHAEVREKGLMEELPLPLLGSMAGYYLDNRRQGDRSVRIDHGVKSPRIIDSEDNTWPAVRSVLAAMNSIDPDYPPLQVHSARLAHAQNNLKVMKRYLEKAVALDNDYFGALHLLGKFYYDMNDPGRAYQYLKRAIESYPNQPAFTRETFYRETEEIGETHALVGHLFYFYFDRVRKRYGDLDDEILESDIERMDNYLVARERYQKALQEGFESPDIHYNLGRIYYMNSQYREALDQWLHLYDEFVTSPELMFSLGNAFYHMGNYQESKGEYLKLIATFEERAEGIPVVRRTVSKHIKVYSTLASVYNNIGAVYQIENDEGKSGISYWKAIDYSKRLGEENEFARVNLARSFRPGREAEPVLDDNIPYSITYFSEDDRPFAAGR